MLVFDPVYEQYESFLLYPHDYKSSIREGSLDVSFLLLSSSFFGPVSVAAYRVHYWVVEFQPRTAAMGTLDSVPLKLKVDTFCARLFSQPDEGQSVSLPPPRSTPLHWTRSRPGTPPSLCLPRSLPLRRLPLTLSP